MHPLTGSGSRRGLYRPPHEHLEPQVPVICRLTWAAERVYIDPHEESSFWARWVLVDGALITGTMLEWAQTATSCTLAERKIWRNRFTDA